MSAPKDTSDIDPTGLPAPTTPELIPDPVAEAPAPEKSGYRPASQDIENVEQLKMVENFIGSIYGEAKQIDKSNIGDSQFTKGLKFNAEQEIKNLRADTKARHTGQPVQQGMTRPPIPPQQAPAAAAAPPQLPPMPPPPVAPGQSHAVPPGDSLILKHEIDEIKNTVADIKKLYDEFFKLKVVKGKWTIAHGDKTTTATTVAKAWNTLNKLLKNKTDKIIIEYKE